MNTTRPFSFLLLIAFLFAVAVAARAESDYERELKQLIERRNSAATAAVAPINSKFKSDAEQLLKRATQSGNAEAVKRIRAAIEDAATHPTDEMKDLRKLLTGTTLTFSDTQVNPGGYLYEVDSRNTVTIIFKGGDHQAMILDKAGKQMKLILGTSEYYYNRTSP
jgi:hypothetical protein